MINISGLDTAKGIAYSGGTEKYYLLALNAYCADAEKHIAALKTPLSEDTLRDFTMRVHSLKSALRIIGAAGLSDEAAALEKAALEAAAHNSDFSTIEQGIEPFLARVIELTERIEEFTSGAAPKVEPSDYSGILEKELFLTLQKELAKTDININAVDKAISDLQKLNPGAKSGAALKSVSEAVLRGDYEPAFNEVSRLAESF